MDALRRLRSCPPPISKADIRDSILDTIGETPLVRLSRIGAGLTPQLVAKVELFNPGGSIKDRVALRLIEAAERDGQPQPGGTIIEPTSGNTGTGLAIAARLKGYRVIAVMPDKMSREKIDLLRAYGAEVVIAPTDVAPESPQSYYRVADRLTEEIPGAFQPNQYRNPANPQTHYETTGPELWRQTGGAAHPPRRRRRHGRHDHRHGAATCASRTPTSRSSAPTRSARSTPATRSTRTSSRAWARTSGPRRTTRRWSTATCASPTATRFLTTRRLAETEGMLVGGSCGLAVHAALEVARGHRRPEGDGRRDPARRRPRVPLEDLQRHLDGLARDARAHERPQRRRRAAREAGRGRDPAARGRRDAARRSATRSRSCTSTASPSSRWSATRTRARSSARSASAGCSSTRPTTRS